MSRLRMYQKLRGEAEQAGAPAGHDESYVLFISLVHRRSWVARDLLQSNPPDATPVKLNVGRASSARWARRVLRRAPRSVVSADDDLQAFPPRRD
jgi:hypothetical protein